MAPACYYCFGFAPIKGKIPKDKRMDENFCIEGVSQTDEYGTLFYKAGISINLFEREAKYRTWAKKNNLECYLTTNPLMFESVKDARGFEQIILDWGNGNELGSEHYDPEWPDFPNTNYQLPDGYTSFGGSTLELFWANPLDLNQGNIDAFSRQYNAYSWHSFWGEFNIERWNPIRKKFPLVPSEEEEFPEHNDDVHYRYYPTDIGLFKADPV